MKHLTLLLGFVCFSLQICFSQDSLTLEQKLYGLSTLWQEANYNFAYFDQVQNINWDTEYQNTISKVIQTKTTEDYYIVLQQFLAKLQDGHTQVYFPESIEKAFSNLPVRVEIENGEYYIINTAHKLKSKLPIGAKIKSIHDLPIEQFVLENVKPQLASSTEQGYKKLIEDFLFYGKRGEDVKISYQFEGKEKTVNVRREYEKYGSFVHSVQKDITENFVFKKVKSLSIVELNSFESDDIIQKFVNKIDDINQTKGLIIDLRENIGGKSIVGLNIAHHIIKGDYIEPMPWKSKHHVASHKAWGNSGLQLVGYNKVDEYKKFGDLNAWLSINPDPVLMKRGRKIVQVPIVVLISENTASSAENFLVYLQQQNSIQLVGTPTFGSTGQPIYFELPQGGIARITAKRNFYPNGEEFVGKGIQPTIFVQNSVRDLLQEKDVQFAKAVELLEKEAK